MVLSVLTACLLALAWAGVASGGIALAWQGLFRRVSMNHAFCRACGYDLYGCEHPYLCPECGGQIAGPESIRIGRIQPDRRRIATGALMVLTSIGTLAFGLRIAGPAALSAPIARMQAAAGGVTGSAFAAPRSASLARADGAFNSSASIPSAQLPIEVTAADLIAADESPDAIEEILRRPPRTRGSLVSNRDVVATFDSAPLPVRQPDIGRRTQQVAAEARYHSARHSQLLMHDPAFDFLDESPWVSNANARPRGRSAFGDLLMGTDSSAEAARATTTKSAAPKRPSAPRR